LRTYRNKGVMNLALREKNYGENTSVRSSLRWNEICTQST